MSHAILLQDWTTVRGNTTGTVVRQEESDYADLAPFQDFVAFIECSENPTTTTMQLETAPTKDDNLFKSMDGGTTFTPSVGVSTRIYRFSAAVVPLARYVRWKIPSSTTAPWSLTFRIWLSPNLG